MREIVKWWAFKGEIKLGDLLLGGKGETVKADSRHVAENPSDYWLIKKFYVATQHIKEGDDIVGYIYGFKGKVVGEGLDEGHPAWELEGGKLHAKMDCWKIIGEVSADADFVEDGRKYEIDKVNNARHCL